MKHALVIILFCFCFSISGNAQVKNTNKQKYNKQAKSWFKALTMPRIGYTQNNGNFFYIGAKYPLLLDENLKSLMVGAKANLGYRRKEFILIPELDIFYALEIIESKKNRIAMGIGANISPYYYAPKLMFEIWIFPQIEIAYNFEFNSHENFNTQGIKCSIGYDLF